jgi:hypothetical protein
MELAALNLSHCGVHFKCQQGRCPTPSSRCLHTNSIRKTKNSVTADERWRTRKRRCMSQRPKPTQSTVAQWTRLILTQRASTQVPPAVRLSEYERNRETMHEAINRPHVKLSVFGIIGKCQIYYILILVLVLLHYIYYIKTLDLANAPL